MWEWYNSFFFVERFENTHNYAFTVIKNEFLLKYYSFIRTKLYRGPCIKYVVSFIVAVPYTIQKRQSESL